MLEYRSLKTSYLSTLPPKSRASLSDLKSSFEQTRGGPNTAKAKGTFYNRQKHYVN